MYEPRDERGHISGGRVKEFAYNLPGLLDVYRPLIDKSVRDAANIGGRSCEEDDLRQEAIIALLSAAATYRTDVGATFGSYAKICIKNRLISYIRKNLRNNEQEILEGGDTKFSSPEDSLIAEEEFSDILLKIKQLLSSYEKAVFGLYISGENNASIAKALGKDIRSVENALFRIREKINKIPPT